MSRVERFGSHVHRYLPRLSPFLAWIASGDNRRHIADKPAFTPPVAV
ncbi:hypothetical protein RSSM_04522 [Rhodopirellula sallentina SM41]|uniref:Uncharacterized protein n=1 Tax=Rhodopirellula sallentina SM41 TaxID=1263870 RepID=M5TXU7_9BACT|nr:hypothetical protein RSSM_04522 [Rhodopirellula sallentina SM41]